MQILVVDVGGTNVKFLVTGQTEQRKFASGPKMTAEEMVAGVRKAANGWTYEAVAIGYPGPVLRGKPVSEPHNLGPGWVGFDFAAAFGCPVRVINDAAMQALGSYQGGRMLFLGLGTGLGSAMIVDGHVEPMELGHLPYKKGTYEDYVGARGLADAGKKKWRERVEDVVARLATALQAEDVVLGRRQRCKAQKATAGLPRRRKLECVSRRISIVGRKSRFEVTATYRKDQVMRANHARRSLSVLLVGFAMALQPAPSLAQEKKSPQQAKSFEKEITIKVKLNYLLFLPEGYESSETKWPLILFLHGAGESGDNVEKVKATGLPKLLETKTDMPFVVVSPQSPRGGWNVDSLSALLDDVIAKYKVDVDRVYLTGLSMGGFGTWELGTAHPERFAAIAPICGGGSPSRAGRLKGVPVWAFHGAKDNVVPIARTEAMIKAMKEAGMEPKFTIYPEAKHDSWTETYNNPELYKWFLEHKRTKPETQ